MRVRLRHMAQDQLTQLEKPIVGFDWKDSGDPPEVFLDGPICARVAVLDFDENTGQLHEPVPFDRTKALARYRVTETPTNRKFQALSVFATVLKTLNLFEDPDVLGRQVKWAFDGNQLLVVPRAGTWRNAFYERETRSLQFFSFPGGPDQRMIHTSLSHDIVAHETGHAILDAINPHLYDCITPQSLALHEAIGDLTALFSTLDIKTLREHLLRTSTDITGLNAYSQVAEEFGLYTGQNGALRHLWNDLTLATTPNHNNFHNLSQVLSGAVYRFLVEVYRELWVAPEGGTPKFSESGSALWRASQLTKRFALRGLDYLPPGEVSFADYGRAIIAADGVSNPREGRFREMFANILGPRLGLQGPDLFAPAVAPDVLGNAIQMDSLVKSDWHAYHFVDANREALHVPGDVPFRIEPRLQITKKTYRGETDAEVMYHEIILKVSWEVLEQGGRNRWVRFGTTAVFDRDGNVQAILTTSPAATGQHDEDVRGRFIDYLLATDLVSFDPMEDGGTATLDDSGLRIRGTGRMLHVAGDHGAPVAMPYAGGRT